MRVLVTGGAGFIGSHLARGLVRAGHTVRIFDDFSTGSRHLASRLDAEVLEGDLRDPSAVASAVEGVEAILHHGAIASVAASWDDPVTNFDVNTLGTATLIEKASAAGVRRLVYASSAAVYGDQAPARKKESTPPRPRSPYAHSKLAAEKIALASSRPGGMTTVALRYFNVYGPGQDPASPYAAVIPLFVGHAVAGTPAELHGDGHQSRDFIYIDDVVAASVLALTDETVHGVALNCATGNSRSLLDLVAAVGEAAGKPLVTVPQPARPGDIRESAADVTAIQTSLGFEAKTPFAEGLRQTLDWFRTQV